jgi:GGDEF domain-containing protein
MNAQELAIWSMALGGIAVVALARLADLVARPMLSQAQCVAYHATVFMLVLILSGIAAQLWPAADRKLMQAAQVLAGPVCISVSSFWIRGWLAAAQRDLLMSWGLRAAALLSPLAALACLALPVPSRLPAAAAVSLFGGVMAAWFTVRAALMGDRLAPVMAAGCLLTLPAIAGMYALAMRVPGMGVGVHATLALCAAASNALTGFALWRRDRHQWRTRSKEAAPSLDPVTKLHGGVSLVHQLIKAQRRRGRTGRDGALLAVLVFDVDRIAAQAGTAGVNEMFICIATRIQRQVGVVNPVCRYYDPCFVSLVESIQSPSWLRTLGLRVATSLRRPMHVTTGSGERMEIKADVGVGVVHLSRGTGAVEDILHEAQQMAHAAREMRSRAAILDPATGRILPVEQADLGPRRGSRARLAAEAH